jgi:hypothetical protein
MVSSNSFSDKITVSYYTMHPNLATMLISCVAAVDTRDQSATAMLSGAGSAIPSGPGAPDVEKLFKAEAENLALSEGLYRWAGEGVEDRVLKYWGKA